MAMIRIKHGSFPVINYYLLLLNVLWSWPESLGEEIFVGGPHIEMVLWDIIGDFLDYSGDNMTALV